MRRQLKIRLAKATLKPDEDAARHVMMITCLEEEGDVVKVERASGTYPAMRAPTIEDLDEPTRLVEDPARHSYTAELIQRRKLEEDGADCLVVDMVFNSSQLGYKVGVASARGLPVLVLREKSTVIRLPRLDQFEDDENITIHEYGSPEELAQGIKAFKIKVRHKLAEEEKAKSRSA